MFLLLLVPKHKVHAEELAYKELEFGKTYTGEVKADNYFDDDNRFSLVLTQKTKISFDFESLTKNDIPGKIDLGISTPDWTDDFYIGEEIFFPYGTKVTKIMTLDKGIYEINISSLISINDYKYRFNANTVTAKTNNIKLEQDEVNVLIGSPYQLLLFNEDKTIFNKEIKWKSSDTNIATVSSNGKITAKKEGICNITITLSEGKTKKCKITVPKPSLERKLYAQPIYAIVTSIDDASIYNDCGTWTINDFTSKDIVHIEYEIIQYNSRGQYIKSPYATYYDDDTYSPEEDAWASFWVNNDTRKARICIKNVAFDDGTEWKNPIYKTWHIKYHGKKY
jgi:hypothetical protein